MAEGVSVAERKAREDEARELRGAAARLRDLLPRFENTPGTEFVPMAVAALLEAIAESVITGRKTGAEMARLYNISPPTVSRIVAQHRTGLAWP